MDEIDIGIDVMTDEELAQMMYTVDPDYEYEKYRDDWGDRLYDALKQTYTEFVLPKKHGYYKDMPEKFLEHSISILKDLTDCELTAFEHDVRACKREPKKVEFVESFKEATDDEKLRTTPRPVLGN